MKVKLELVVDIDETTLHDDDYYPYPPEIYVSDMTYSVTERLEEWLRHNGTIVSCFVSKETPMDV